MRVNGQTYKLEKSCSLKCFLEQQNYQVERVVVEHNGEVITREQFEAVQLHDTDTLEIVHFVGGG